MGHLPKLIEDLALILIVAAVTTLLFRRIKQPLVLGYIIAGFLVGPHLSITPTVADSENIKTLAEIGVIFLLFSLGLEFSFKKLVRVGGAASITGLIGIAFITASGYLVGRWMDWSFMDSLFLGGMLASSSTTIIIKAFDELGVKTKQFAQVVFGILVVEDIVVILLMVLLSTIAITNQFEGTEMLFTVAKLFFFLLLWFIAGIFLLPTFLRKAKSLLDDETLLILAIGLCLGMVIIARQSGFSAELGAFIMGSILAETTKAEKIEHLVKPVKDLFGAVFFVSVGMLIDPVAIMENRWAILWVTLLILAGRFFSSTIGALLSGQPLKQSIQVGMSLAQIGEFAFIVASLGLALGVTSNFLFPVAVGASVITTFTTPYRIMYSEKIYDLIVRILPEKWVKNLSDYSSSTQNIKTEKSWKKVFKSYMNIVVTNGIVLMALMLISINFLHPLLSETITNPVISGIIVLAISIGLSSPFLWALMAKRPDNIVYKELWLHIQYSKGPLLVLEISRVTIGILLIGFWVSRIFSTGVAILIAIPLIIMALRLFSRRIQKFYHRLEQRFLSNLNAREIAEEENSYSEKILRKHFKPESELVPWDAHMIDLQVNQNADYIGKTLEELAWREKFGINLAYIKRGDKLIYAPSRFNKLLPFDHVGIIASDEQMQLFKPAFDATEPIDNVEYDVEDIVVQKIVVDEHNRLKGLTVRNSGIRERTNGLIFGIERNNERILNPNSQMVFEWGDIVWIVGERKKIQQLNAP
ncbi:MAG: sodium:proton antiporter [Sphingobacteriales bacterium 17-39-43]|uniref:cation:proton antiporter domain-containing protein n=1 Tax=Daejeonella sp. TaxID=2805397 RepID=UPI000BDDA4ED|nr:cation:proton antiporter [Daejeonella sp.]OYZ30611.1 MAG: sodium:proton antiporter [Sphingobacteriales bacterium 16-39-50]OZA23304.1 MAG: sodium:proton antiporter [Sphingobacteriales bacterium 17-39-43]HQT23397.1 cation:proton antiporter [Daejeonella sp.]HQT57866.1 cation:proton antiporter [Daejeonella sp.]